MKAPFWGRWQKMLNKDPTENDVELNTDPSTNNDELNTGSKNNDK